MRLYDVEMLQRRQELEGGRQMLKGLAVLAKAFIVLWLIVMAIGLLAAPGLREQERRDDGRPAQQERVQDAQRGR